MFIKTKYKQQNMVVNVLVQICSTCGSQIQNVQTLRDRSKALALK